eukprot:COSAG05_NODE_5261_length_1221_cov_2.129234_1_plen_104_part_00
MAEEDDGDTDNPLGGMNMGDGTFETEDSGGKKKKPKIRKGGGVVDGLSKKESKQHWKAVRKDYPKLANAEDRTRETDYAHVAWTPIGTERRCKDCLCCVIMLA